MEIKNTETTEKIPTNGSEKLEKSKSDFANELLYRILTTEKDIPKLPKYIQNGFNILAKKLEERV